MTKQNILVGKTLSGIKIADDKGAILFQLSGEDDVMARADGDCCSYTWVENVELPARGFPAVVQSVENLDLPDRNVEKDDGDFIQFYRCKITTDRGVIVIDYRNESNGYYGGNLSWPGEYHYGGVYGQNNSKCVWVDVDEA